MRSTTATIPGPRMLVSGPALGITGGHCDDNLLAPEFNYRSDGVADGIDGVRTRSPPQRQVWRRT